MNNALAADKKRSNLILVIQFAVDCFDCPWTVRTIVLVVWDHAVFLAKDVEGVIVIISWVFVGAS